MEKTQQKPNLRVYVYGKKTMKILSDNNMNVIELRYDSAGSVVIIVFGNNNVNMIISYVPFFVNLLGILSISWHHGWDVEKHLGRRIRKVRSKFAGAAKHIESTHETKMFALKIDMPTDSLQKLFEMRADFFVVKEFFLSLMTSTDENESNFVGFALIQFIQGHYAAPRF